ncbi:hypothetical protein FS837_011066 [Tulasnella sp. UAMH 9824]|nr:hypothetical protein FS837_011066 [Tulasnella sp. UAMH 9824]
MNDYKPKTPNPPFKEAENDVESTTNDQDSLDAARYVATAVLQQGLDFCKNTLNDEEQLTYHSKLLPGSTIGKHLRHARDHFHLLIHAFSQPPPYVLSYDTRTRDTPMERSLPAAIESLQTSIDELNSIFSPEVAAASGSLEHGGRPRLANDTPLTLHAVTPFPQILQTSLGRELWFVALHAIHHYAVVRMLAGELELDVDETFGVAPSTLQYRAGEAPAIPEKAKI